MILVGETGAKVKRVKLDRWERSGRNGNFSRVQADGEIEASTIGEMVPSKVPLGTKIGAGVKLAS